MEKLTIKELAPYLPYGLRVILGTTERDLTAVSIDSQYVFVTAYKGSRDKQMAGIESIKPILRPLSELTREIEHNGEKFVPIYLIEVEGYVIGWNGFGITIGQEEGYSFGYAMDVHNNIIQKLLEWHFDVFGLREKGLCIYYNEL